MGAFNILTLTCRLGRYSERPSLSFFWTVLSLRTKARCRLAHGVASSGREACPNTYRHPEGVRTYTSLNHSW